MIPGFDPPLFTICAFSSPSCLFACLELFRLCFPSFPSVCLSLSSVSLRSSVWRAASCLQRCRHGPIGDLLPAQEIFRRSTPRSSKKTEEKVRSREEEREGREIHSSSHLISSQQKMLIEVYCCSFFLTLLLSFWNFNMASSFLSTFVLFFSFCRSFVDVSRASLLRLTSLPRFSSRGSTRHSDAASYTRCPNTARKLISLVSCFSTLHHHLHRHLPIKKCSQTVREGQADRENTSGRVEEMMISTNNNARPLPLHRLPVIPVLPLRLCNSISSNRRGDVMPCSFNNTDNSKSNMNTTRSFSSLSSVFFNNRKWIFLSRNHHCIIIIIIFDKPRSVVLRQKEDRWRADHYNLSLPLLYHHPPVPLLLLLLCVPLHLPRFFLYSMRKLLLQWRKLRMLPWPKCRSALVLLRPPLITPWHSEWQKCCHETSMKAPKCSTLILLRMMGTKRRRIAEGADSSRFPVFWQL